MQDHGLRQGATDQVDHTQVARQFVDVEAAPLRTPPGLLEIARPQRGEDRWDHLVDRPVADPAEQEDGQVGGEEPGEAVLLDPVGGRRHARGHGREDRHRYPGAANAVS